MATAEPFEFDLARGAEPDVGLTSTGTVTFRSGPRQALSPPDYRG